MKNLGWLIIAVMLSANAQDVVVNPPLDINEDGTRILKPDMPTGTIVPAKIDPVDGQLKLESKHDSKPVEGQPPVGQDTKQEKQDDAKTAEITIKPRVSKPESLYPLEKYIQFSYGYLNSKWKKADPSLDNGSALTNFRIVSDMNKRNQLGFAIELIHDNSNASVPDNIRVVQYRLFLDHHRPLFTGKLDWIAGLALTIGDYSIVGRSHNDRNQEVATQIKSGTVFGVIPSAGLRFYLGAHNNSIDIAVEYHNYLSSPQRYISGLAFVPRFSFVF